MSATPATRPPRPVALHGVKVVSTKFAARLVGLSESTLATLRLNGNGPVYCKLGRRVVYRTSDLEQWLAAVTSHAQCLRCRRSLPESPDQRTSLVGHFKIRDARR